MPLISQFLLYSLIIVSTLILNGCVTLQTRPSDQIISDFSHTTSSTQINKAISVNSVKVNKIEKGYVVANLEIDSNKFQQLLIGGINKSNLFKEATAQPHGEYHLKSEIIYQETIPGMTSVTILLVHYELFHPKSGMTLWENNIYTQIEMSAKQIYSGNKRMVHQFEKAIIKNIESMLKQIEKVLI